SYDDRKDGKAVEHQVQYHIIRFQKINCGMADSAGVRSQARPAGFSTSLTRRVQHSKSRRPVRTSAPPSADASTRRAAHRPDAAPHHCSTPSAPGPADALERRRSFPSARPPVPPPAPADKEKE